MFQQRFPVILLLLCFSTLSFADDPVARTIGTFDQLDGMFSGYARDNGQFPGPAGSIQDIASALMAHSHTFGANALAVMDGWGHGIRYFYSESEKVFFLISYGADGRPDSGLYDSSGKPQLRNADSGKSGQDLICKHDLKSGPNQCQMIASPSSSARNAAPSDEDESELTKRQELSDAMNSMNHSGASDSSGDFLAKQQSTAQRMRKIGGALQSFSNQNSGYPAGASLSAISGNLVPAFVKDIPRKDGWGNEIQYVVQKNGSNCWLISYGADGQPDSGQYERNGRPVEEERQHTNGPNDDLIYSCEKGFIRAPSGIE